MFNPTSTALIPYTPPISAMEFVRSEVDRGLLNGSIKIEQIYPNLFPSIYLDSLNEDGVSRIARILSRISQKSQASSETSDKTEAAYRQLEFDGLPTLDYDISEITLNGKPYIRYVFKPDSTIDLDRYARQARQSQP